MDTPVPGATIAPMIRVQVSYQGRVQGVGFRASVCATAAGFRVTGWVRNQPDGSVLLEAQGSPAQVESFLTRVHADLQRFIRNVTRVPASPVEGEDSFTILR